MSETKGVVPTSIMTFVESTHGKLRRNQRCIGKKDLNSAKKNGKMERGRPRPNGDPVVIYRYKNIVYVMNERTGEEITSYAKPVELERVPISTSVRKSYNRAKLKIQTDLSSWTSNTVLAIDTSGSMKNCDVWDTKTRLDAVWLSIALDFLADRLESGYGDFDVVSIVSIGPSGEVLLREEPTSWVLYNKIIDIYMKKTIEPFGHGHYIPSLDEAERLLTRNACASCVPALFISF